MEKAQFVCGKLQQQNQHYAATPRGYKVILPTCILIPELLAGTTGLQRNGRFGQYAVRSRHQVNDQASTLSSL